MGGNDERQLAGKREAILEQTRGMLQRLGVTANYAGYFHASYAVCLASEHPQYLLMVSKSLYPEVARQYETTAGGVERNIRTVSGIAWRKRREALEDLAMHPLPKRPTASEFIAILSAASNGRDWQ